MQSPDDAHPQGPAGEPSGPADDVRERVAALFPPEFRQHYRAARREFWLAVRALVDARISAIEATDRPQQPPPRHGRVDITD
jgi:hypothetical protein